MTIVELIESLCSIIGEMAEVINRLSLRLQQTGIMTEGERQELEEIRKRLSAMGISIEE